MNSISKKSISISSTVQETLSVWAPVLFLVFVFLLGGGARSDVMSLPLLRGVAVLVTVWAALQMKPADWGRIGVPLSLMIFLTLWMALQLVPLPPAFWHGLPSRGIIVEIDQLLGQADIWRPISLSPIQTWNALLGMAVVFASLLMAARLTADDFGRVMFAIVVLACASAMLGLLQAVMGSGSPAYLYRITNSGEMVGLFANRNHHAIFLACATLVAAMLLRDEFMRKRRRSIVRIGLIFAIILLTAITVLIGSRAGFGAGVVAFLASYAIVVVAWRSRTDKPLKFKKKIPSLTLQRLLLYAPPLFMLMFVGTMVVLSNRVTSVTRLAGQVVASDMRVLAWPTVETMISKFWLLGSGFGSFPDVYRMFEPDSLLQPAYFNHVHNDWAEMLVTGGLPFALIVIVGLVWLTRKATALGSRNLVKGYRGDLRLPIILILVIIAFASFVDYPLRVPSMQVFAIILVVQLCCRRTAQKGRE